MLEVEIRTKHAIKRIMPSGYLYADLIPDPLLIIKPDGTVYDINTSCAKQIGMEKKFLLGKYFGDVDFLKALGDRLANAINNNAEDFDLIVYKDKHFEVFILPFSAEDGSKLVRVAFKDISNFVTLEKELLKRNKELIIINTLSGAFIASEDIDLVAEDILKKVLLVADFSVGWLLLKEGQSFTLRTCKGISPAIKNALEGGALDSLCNNILAAAAPLYIIEHQDIAKIDLFRGENMTFVAAIPLVSDKNTFGLLFLADRGGKERHFDFDSAALLSLIGNHVSLIIDKIRLFQETRRLSITDGLTGLYNSRFFYKQLEAEIARTKRYGDSFSIILFDIDNFKQINDRYGHQAGDDVLHDLAIILKSASRETDIVVRYGGEEFIIILPNTPEKDTVFFADRIRADVEKKDFLSKHYGGINITLSGGIASCPQDGADTRALLNAADCSLYAAKIRGKNMVLCFRDTSHSK